jgi:cation diffusion facilitator family transporter
MLGTMAINGLVTTYEYRKGKKLNSEVLVADSFHTRSDIVVSLSVILSLVVTRLGYPIVDPIIALGIAAAIAKMGIDIVRESSQVLTDMAALDLKLVEKLVMRIENVKGCHAIRTRGPAENIYVDLHVEVLPELSAEEGHAVATKVEQKVKADLKGVADVIVHIEPFQES